MHNDSMLSARIMNNWITKGLDDTNIETEIADLTTMVIQTMLWHNHYLLIMIYVE